MRVRFDEQIFVVQKYGGISRMFASLAREFTRTADLGVEVETFYLPIVNRYILDDAVLSRSLNARPANSWQMALTRYLAHRPPRVKVDVEHSTFYLPHGRPRGRARKSVVTVHDLIPELLPDTRRRLDFLTVKKRYVTEADHVVCVSEATRQDLIRLYPEVADRTEVIHHGVDEQFTPTRDPRSSLARPYLLFVGNRGQYKDGMLALNAFVSVAQTHPDLDLVLVGGGPLTKLETASLPIALRSRVRQKFVPDAQMPSVYSCAQALVFPSRFEGFGMPVLEAMACGTPVIAAHASSLPEVGGEACLYFTPGHTDELISAIDAVLSSSTLRKDLSEKGLARASNFTWTKSAERYAEIYRR